MRTVSEQDMSKAFLAGWQGGYGFDDTYLNNCWMDSVAVRQFVDAMARNGLRVDSEPSDGALMIFGYDIAKILCRGWPTKDREALERGLIGGEDLIRLGRAAHRALAGPKSNLLKAIIRRFQ